MILTATSEDRIDWNATGDELLKNNIINILKLRKGEVKFDGNMGIDPDYIDNPLTAVKGKIMCDILENILTYYPQCEVKSIDVDSEKTTGDIILRAVIEI